MSNPLARFTFEQRISRLERLVSRLIEVVEEQNLALNRQSATRRTNVPVALDRRPSRTQRPAPQRRAATPGEAVLAANARRHERIGRW